MAGRMWLANANYGAWVPCPSIEMPSGTQKWGASGQFLNGGAYVRRSITGARVFEMNWPMKHQADLDTVEAFFEGSYGEGPFFVAEPGSMRYNMFPAYLASPGMGVSDGPTLLYDKRPTVAQYSGSSGEPIRGAAYSKLSADMINKFTIAVPEGHTLHTSIDATAGCMMASNMDGSPATEGTPGAPGTDYAWTGTPGESTSTKSVDGAVVAHNYNPAGAFRYGLDGYSSWTNAESVTLDTETYQTGTQSVHVVGSDAINRPQAFVQVFTDASTYPGSTIRAQAWIRTEPGASSTAAGIRLGGAGVVTSAATALTEGGWQLVTCDATVNASGAILMYLYGAAGIGVSTWIDSVRLGEPDGHGIFDGGTPDIPEIPSEEGGLAHGIRQWTGGRLLQFHLNPDYIGTAVVYSMCAVAVPDSEPFDMGTHVNSGRFPRGKGSTGMEVDGDFERTSYSAALDRYHGSVRLVEVEPWL